MIGQLTRVAWVAGRWIERRVDAWCERLNPRFRRWVAEDRDD